MKANLNSAASFNRRYTRLMIDGVYNEADFMLAASAAKLTKEEIALVKAYVDKGSYRLVAEGAGLRTVQLRRQIERVIRELNFRVRTTMNHPLLDRLIWKILDESATGTRTANALKGDSLDTVRDVIKRTPEALMKIPNMGHASIRKLENALSRHGLILGMNLEDIAAWECRYEEV